MVLPEGEVRESEEAVFRRNSLLLLAEIRDYNRRMCDIMERLFGQQQDDPRYQRKETWR